MTQSSMKGGSWKRLRILKIGAGLLALCVLFTGLLVGGSANAGGQGLEKQRIYVNGTKRVFYLHRPKGDHSGKLPLVMMFHGGKGTGEKIAEQTGFNRTADKYGFVVVYPNSTGNWQDGRSSTGDGWEDIDFIRAMIDHLEETENVDRRRVYSTGISNGGIFTLRLACDASDLIAAFAPVAASMAEPYAPKCDAKRPVPMLIIHGSEDKWVRYEGGEVKQLGKGGAGGRVIPIPETVNFWLARNQCSADSPIQQRINPNKRDRTKVDVMQYRDCAPNSTVTLIRVMGGGHTWPGSPKKQGFVAKRLVGRTTQDIIGTEVIWDFFSHFALP